MTITWNSCSRRPSASESVATRINRLARAGQHRRDDDAADARHALLAHGPEPRLLDAVHHVGSRRPVGRLRSLKRRISDAVYRQLLADSHR
jgi:hypothetical protein